MAHGLDEPGDGEALRPWLDALFGDAPDGVAISRAGLLLYTNPRLDDRLGAAEGELEGCPSLELYSESERSTVEAELRAMISSDRSQAVSSATFRRRDGSGLRLEVARMLLPVRDDLLVIEIARDLPTAPPLA